MKTLMIFASIITFALCVPAFQGPMEFKQNDGSTFQGKLKGDEWFNWIEDKEGRIVKYNNSSKNYEYAKVEEKNGTLELVPSGTKVDIIKKLDRNASEFFKIDREILKKIWNQKKEKAYEYKKK